MSAMSDMSGIYGMLNGSVISGASGSSGTSGIFGAQSSAQSSAQALVDSAKADSFESQLKSAMTDENKEELKDACQQFEELMLSMLYKSMKMTINRSELFPSDPGRDTYEQWQDESMVKKLAENGSFGLADMMYSQLVKRMENSYELVDESE